MFYSLVLRVMLGVTGLILTTEGDENYDANARILVSNHTLFLDHIITDLIVPHIMVSILTFV